MAEGKTFLRFVAVAALSAFLMLVAMCALPHERYLRFQSLTELAVVKSGWIYERTHFDPKPIDIVFIGTSHTVMGVDSDLVERTCREKGASRCATVNFALEHLGRNVQWLVAREVIEARQPKLMVVEVQETEFRALHPAFAPLAEPSDILAAPLVINTSYFPDLLRLPLRQVSLFARSRIPSLFGVHKDFRPALYRGAHWDDTYAEYGSIEHPNKRIVPRTGVQEAAELDRERASVTRQDNEHRHLPGSLQQLEYRANLYYLEKLLMLAREKNIAIRFLFIPSYRAAGGPAFADFYRRFAPTWRMPEEIVADHTLWHDVGHLNNAGSVVFSRWLGAKIPGEISVMNGQRTGSEGVSPVR